MTNPWSASREQLKAALDYRETARNNSQLDRALESASRAIEGEFHRRFYPEVDTRYFDWPNRQHARPWRLWLGDNELISVTTLTAGGTALTEGSDFLLRRSDGKDTPPYTHVEINLAGSASFAAGDSHQRAIAITGLFGYRNDEAAAGALEAAVASAGTTTVDVTDSSAVGVGTLLRVDTERTIVTRRSLLDTGQNTGGVLTASAANTTVPVADGTGFAVDEVILVDAERMLVVDIAGNNLIVRRQWDGTVLAAHSSGVDVYAPRRLTVVRGALGTAAATHDDAAAVFRHVPPGPITAYCLALAINQVLQESAGYARTVGSAENEREAAGRGLRSARSEAWTAYARKFRMAAV
jgi:hypothetical protein